MLTRAVGRVPPMARAINNAMNTIRHHGQDAATAKLTPSLAPALLGLALLASCVSQGKYDETLESAKRYQTQVHDLSQYVAQLEARSEQLKGELALSQVEVLEAGFDTRIEHRMGELQEMLNTLGRPPGDVERFDVEGGYVYMVQDKVLFASGSAEVGAEGQKALAQVASEIAALPHGRVWVRGHTDSDPIVRPKTLERFPGGNLELSAARAVGVASLLVASKQIPAADMVVAGFGPHEPVVANDSADNKRLNRRVEIFVQDAQIGGE